MKRQELETLDKEALIKLALEQYETIKKHNCIVKYNNCIYFGNIVREGKDICSNGKLVALEETPKGLFHNKMWFKHEEIIEF